MIKREYKNKKILIVGMARSGLAAGRFLSKRGAEVFGYDAKNIGEIALGKNCPVKLIDQKDPRKVNLDRYDLIVTSPGVKRDNSIIKRAKKAGLPVISELEAGLSVLPQVNIIAVTGTNGKTTTVKLLEFLTGALVAGNIGTPLTSVADQIKKGDLVILEVSSYQIPFSPSLTPEVAVLLNLFPEHLDWHGGYDNYVADKMALFSRQTKGQAALLNYSIKKDHPELAKSIKSRKFFFSTRQKVRGAYIKEGGLYFSTDSGEELLMPVKNYKLKGEHNLENLAAAACAARLAGVREFPDISGFRALAHRMEEVICREGVLYINDSKATNMDSLYKAVKSLEAPLILLAGGRSKEILHSGLKDAVAGKAREIILFGESRGTLKKYFSSLKVKSVPLLKDAVSLARDIAEAGDTVLLSPGGSSFDEFKDYRERGEKFKEWVKD